MTRDLHQSLREHFGFEEFLPGQREVVEHLLEGRSAAAVFPTGGGKSLCYQLPALLMDGVTLVVSPLIALMKDQIDALTERGIAACRIDSTLSADEYREAMRRVRAGELRLLYVAPERFQNERFREAIEHLRVALFAVDEAHCISEWGHNFRPDYLKLVQFARHCGAERLLALTATATPQVLSDICQAFGIESECAVRNSCYRRNLTLLTTPVESPARDALVVERLRERAAGPTIVYVTLQRTAEKLAGYVASQGFDARAYHAGMEDEQRAATQEWFMQSDSGIVVATIAFGMGIDKANIRYVYHYNMPKSLENYSQEIGRAGRDAAPATCEMLVCQDDLNQLENFALGDTPTLTAVARFVQEIFGLEPQFDVSYHELSKSSNIRLLVVRTLLTYLELDGFLEGGTPFYESYRFQPLCASSEILAQFDGERREFLKRLLAQARKGKTWFRIDAHQAAAQLQVPRERVIRALDYLGERGWLNLQAAGTRNRYRRLKMPPDLAELGQSLHERTLKREKNELARLAQVLDLAAHEQCQVSALCRHFGETRPEPCGHCTRCLNAEATVSLPARKNEPIDEAVLEEAFRVRDEHPRALSNPQTMARWLCGVKSPALTREKLARHHLFGALEQQPMAELQARLEQEAQQRPRVS